MGYGRDIVGGYYRILRNEGIFDGLGEPYRIVGRLFGGVRKAARDTNKKLSKIKRIT